MVQVLITHNDGDINNYEMSLHDAMYLMIEHNENHALYRSVMAIDVYAVNANNNYDSPLLIASMWYDNNGMYHFSDYL